MGHSTSSGRNAGGASREEARQPVATPAAPRYEMPLDFRSAVPSIVRNLNQRLSIVNDNSDMDVVRRGDDEYEVTRQWQEAAPNGGYYSRRETTTMNRGQAARAIRREVSERSTVRLGNETLLRYRRNRG